MTTYSAKHAVMLLDTARKNLASRHNRKRTGMTPKQVARWLMTMVQEMHEADGWAEDIEAGKGGAK